MGLGTFWAIFLQTYPVILPPGPSFWGLINPDWSLCNAGMSQSPINIKPQNVLFDPRLKDLVIGEAKVSHF
jgi:hypothetical protein